MSNSLADSPAPATVEHPLSLTEFDRLAEGVLRRCHVLDPLYFTAHAAVAKDALRQVRKLGDAARSLVTRLNEESTGWAQTAPTEQGIYWHWSGDPDTTAFPLFVMWSGTERKCFVARNSMDATPWCDELGGYWSAIREPAVPRI